MTSIAKDGCLSVCAMLWPKLTNAAGLQVDMTHVVVDCKSNKVHCTNEALKGRVATAVQRMMTAMKPISVNEANEQ